MVWGRVDAGGAIILRALTAFVVYTAFVGAAWLVLPTSSARYRRPWALRSAYGTVADRPEPLIQKKSPWMNRFG